MNKYNPAIAVLKFLASFAVVWTHYGSVLGSFHFVCALAVPSFVFLAVYLTRGLLDNADWHSVGKRLLRIALPFWFWGVACWLFYGERSCNDLLTQLTFGGPCCPPLYFMPLLMLITVLLYCVFRYCDPYKYLILAVIFFSVFGFQYSGLNYLIFSHFGETTLGYFWGRFFELIPISIIAAVWSRHDDVKFALFSGFAFMILGSSVAFIDTIRLLPGFGYQGLVLFSLSTGLCMVTISIGKLCIRIDGSIVRTIGNLSVGVYLTHAFIGPVVQQVSNTQNGVFLACVVFCCSALASFLLGLIRPIRIFVL